MAEIRFAIRYARSAIEWMNWFCRFYFLYFIGMRMES